MSPPTAKTYEEAISAYLSMALEAQEFEAFLEAIGHIARGHGIGAVAEHSGLGRESLYKALGKGAKPRFETVCKVVQSLGLKLAVLPATSKARRG
jgi:probable addiction module antidote protein